MKNRRQFRFEQLEQRIALAADLRVAMPLEGYLAMQNTTAHAVGYERPGYTSIKSPANAGFDDARLGYDYSQFQIPIHITLVKTGNAADNFDC